ncbi:MAG TPA: response regulator [Roseiflexaceae bacterium]|nr:response regulator [Roseiflexaceae bacterium]
MAHILVADDEPAIRSVLQKWLGHAGHQVTLADNGQTALLHARDLQPDLCILDVQMPYINGIQVAQTLRDDPRTAAIPLIALSAQLSYIPDEMSDGLFDTLIAKPFDLIALSSDIERLLQSSRP